MRTKHFALLVVLASKAMAASYDVAASETGEVAAEGPILLAGPTVERATAGRTFHSGANIGVEWPMIEGWLELEVGLSSMNAAGHTEMSGDFVLEKPFRLSDSSEFMVGIGPSYMKTLGGPDRIQGTLRGTELSIEYMRWTSKESGWFIQPSWTDVRKTGERSLGLTAGLTFHLR